LRPKTEKFSPHFFDVARLNFFQKGKENFSVLDFCLSAFGGRKQKGGSGATVCKYQKVDLLAPDPARTRKFSHFILPLDFFYCIEEKVLSQLPEGYNIKCGK